MDEIASPRRYSVKMDVPADAVGPLFGLLIKEVEQPKMEPSLDGVNHRITLICMMDQVPTIVAIIVKDAVQFFVGPYNPEAKSVATYKPPQQLARVVTPLEKDTRKFIRAKGLPNVPGGAKTRNTATGKAILTAFADGVRVKHPADFVEAIVKAGFSGTSYASVVNRLVSEGDLVRIGHGAYRLPSALERDSFSGEDPGSTNST